MIGKIKTGTGFSGVLKYSLQEEKRPEIVSSNMLGITAKELNAEFTQRASLNGRIEKPMKHFIMSFHADDQKKINNHKLEKICSEYLGKMGYEQSQFVAIRHRDTDHDHLHIIANRVRMDNGKAVKDGKERFQSRKVMMELEKKHNLTKTPKLRQQEERSISNSEKEMLNAQLMRSDKDKIKEMVEASLNLCNSLPEAIEALCNSGLKAEITKSKKGKVTGWKFTAEGRQYKASSIDRELSYGKILKHFENKNKIEQERKILQEQKKNIKLNQGKKKGPGFRF